MARSVMPSCSGSLAPSQARMQGAPISKSDIGATEDAAWRRVIAGQNATCISGMGTTRRACVSARRPSLKLTTSAGPTIRTGARRSASESRRARAARRRPSASTPSRARARSRSRPSSADSDSASSFSRASRSVALSSSSAALRSTSSARCSLRQRQPSGRPARRAPVRPPLPAAQPQSHAPPPPPATRRAGAPTLRASAPSPPAAPARP